MDVTFLLLGTLCLIFILKIVPALYTSYVFRKKLSKLPSPPTYPLIGNALEPMRMRKEDRTKWFKDLSFQFEKGLFVFWVGHEAIVHFRHPKHLEALLPSTVNINKATIYKYVEPWLGKGLITSTGEKWFHDRKLITPAFHFNILENFSLIMSEKAQILVKAIDKELEKKPAQPLDVFPFILRCALDVICETAMGINVHAQTERENEYCKAVRRSSEIIIHRLFRPWLRNDFIFNLSSVGREYKANLELLHKFTRDVIIKRKQSRAAKMQNGSSDHKSTENDIGQHKRKAFLDLMLDTLENESNKMTDEELREQVDTFMFAGHDTTAAATSWTLFCLGNNPEVQEKAQAEIDEILGDSDEPITFKQVGQMKYLERVIKECLRLFPSVAGFSRKLVEDIHLEECTIPKGVVVSMSPIVIHIDPEIWPDPMKFDPDRFLPENSKNRHPYAYVPFSAGPRNCIGQKFAIIEEKTLIASILRKWNIKSVESMDTIKYYSSIILRPSEGIYVYMRPRNVEPAKNS